jgi:predicted secreted protein
MVTAAVSAHSTILQFDAGGGTWATVAEVSSISTSLSSDELDVTSHDSTGKWREWIQGLKGAEISIEGNFLAGSTTHGTNSQTGMLGLFTAGTKRNMRLRFSDSGTTTWTFSGLIREISYSASVDDKLSFTATVRISGVMTLA